MVSKPRSATPSSSTASVAQEIEVQQEVDTNSGAQEEQEEPVIAEEADNESGEEEVVEIAPRVLDVFEEHPASTLELMRAKQAFNSQPNTSAAAKSISDFVAKTGGESRANVNVAQKSIQLLQLLVAQEALAEAWFDTNGGAGKAGAGDHIRSYRTTRAVTLNSNEVMRAIKLHLVMQLKQLRIDHDNAPQFTAAGLRENFPTSQKPEILLKGLMDMKSKKEAATIGDPLKERTLKLARLLNVEENKHVSAEKTLEWLETYFEDISGMDEKEDFGHEFYHLMALKSDNNGPRTWLFMLREQGVMKPDGSIIDDGPSILQLLERFQLQVMQDIRAGEVLALRWRINESASHKRGPIQGKSADEGAFKKKKSGE